MARATTIGVSALSLWTLAGGDGDGNAMASTGASDDVSDVDDRDVARRL